MPIEVSGWCPLPGPPESDDAYFEALTAAVFQARFRPAIVEARWPAIRAAFADFDLAVVTTWQDADLARLLSVPGMIRNPKKILATLRNARDLQARRQAFGSLEAYFRHLDGERLVADVDSWAHYVGAPSIRWFLRCTGHLPNRQDETAA